MVLVSSLSGVMSFPFIATAKLTKNYTQAKLRGFSLMEFNNFKGFAITQSRLKFKKLIVL